MMCVFASVAHPGNIACQNLPLVLRDAMVLFKPDAEATMHVVYP
jgi:hypothetical protein